MKRSRSIALVGPMGAGKSVVARLLGARLGLPAVDLDEEIERVAEAKVPVLFARGEAAFRDLEERALERALEGAPCVLACGGGIVERAPNRARLRSCRTVWLQVSPGEAAERLARDVPRPLLAGRDPAARWSELLARRVSWYAEVAELQVSTDGRDPESVVDAIESGLAGRS